MCSCNKILGKYDNWQLKKDCKNNVQRTNGSYNVQLLYVAWGKWQLKFNGLWQQEIILWMQLQFLLIICRKFAYPKKERNCNLYQLLNFCWLFEIRNMWPYLSQVNKFPYFGISDIFMVVTSIEISVHIWFFSTDYISQKLFFCAQKADLGLTR